MIKKIVGILLDEKQVIVNIFNKSSEQIITSKYIYKRLKQKNNKLFTASIVEFIAQIAISPEAQSASDWKIYGRKINPNILKKIGSATSVSIEKLTSKREQELICKGIMSES
jgi:hypothetical protein